MNDYTTSFTVGESPEVVFNAINDVRAWWGEGVDGSNTTLGDEFTYRVDGVHYSKLRVTELVPNETVAWRVLENDMGFVQDQTEWVGTTIRFQIERKDGETEVR